MSNSPLVDYTKLSPNHSGKRNHKIDTITIHHMAGNLSVETCGSVFAPKSRRASSNYGIDSKGRVGLYVDEGNRSWATSSSSNDNRAVTIEVANDQIGGQWHVSDKALSKLIDLCTDICRRNGIKKLNYTGNKSGNLTKHEWFASTNCPGPYLGSKFPYIAEQVNKRLGTGGSNASKTEKAKNAVSSSNKSSFTVQIDIANLNIRKGAGVNYPVTGKYTGKGKFTIVEKQSGAGSKAGWGKLKSGAGWISLDYAKEI